jgi:hypothetical protein
MRAPALFTLGAMLVCAADSGRLDGPAPAMLFDSASRAVRPMVGVAGSAYLAGAVAHDVDNAVASPDGTAVALVKEGSLHVLRNGAATALADNVAGAIAWSADSLTIATERALVSTSGGRTVRLAAWDGNARAIAAAADHAAAAAPGGIWLLTADSARRIAIADDPIAVDIAGSDLYFADRARGEVWMMRNYRNGGEPVLVAKLDGVVGVEAEGRVLIIAGGRKVLALRSGGFEPLFEIELDFEATSLARLNRSTWLLNAGREGTPQVLSTDGEPAVYFVPRNGEAN